MNKKGISAVVGYVLLISITLALSVMVFNWLKFYVSSEEIGACSKDVNVIVSNWDCYETFMDLGSATYNYGNLTITLKNKGLFIVDGYIIRVHDRADADFGFYAFNMTGKKLKPGESDTNTYMFDELLPPHKDYLLSDLTIIEIQPFINNEKGNMTCKTKITQKVDCISPLNL